jgi:hypothetical protein
MPPCGGITPQDPMGGIPAGLCWTCDEYVSGNPNDGLYVEEWDAVIHRHCLGYFLASPEGIIVLGHGHQIIVPEL